MTLLKEPAYHGRAQINFMIMRDFNYGNHYEDARNHKESNSKRISAKKCL